MCKKLLFTVIFLTLFAIFPDAKGVTVAKDENVVQIFSINRYQLEKTDTGTILLDTKTGNTWMTIPCPNVHVNYCWASMLNLGGLSPRFVEQNPEKAQEVQKLMLENLLKNQSPQ